MHRATQRYLGLPNTHRSQDGQFLALKSVALEPLARKHLFQAVDIRGRWTGGALFGIRQTTTLVVTLAACQAPPSATTDPLTPSLPFLMGVTQGVSTVLSEDVDWAGQWLTAPDGRLPDRQVELAWVTLGGHLGLIDEKYPLLVIGLQEGLLTGRAYLWLEGQPAEIACLVDHRA
ncbi:hypothetical protein HNQ07_004061 [Deinococcus metalli]|uniref:Uncharacterized protein n=1 Tax=Deinococcus metalli TaxID=1141878 RepID=A0A7W8KL47_9DEIO|nr:hypothetical protein [Deinococcus metalli]MBB5378554.1 hypothetical protein [Deinococcus metalli]GHF58570.1 hypothetical protein GCM10017781_38570 [Deinococcus metalli]